MRAGQMHSGNSSLGMGDRWTNSDSTGRPRQLRMASMEVLDECRDRQYNWLAPMTYPPLFGTIILQVLVLVSSTPPLNCPQLFNHVQRSTLDDPGGRVGLDWTSGLPLAGLRQLTWNPPHGLRLVEPLWPPRTS